MNKYQKNNSFFIILIITFVFGIILIILFFSLVQKTQAQEVFCSIGTSTWICAPYMCGVNNCIASNASCGDCSGEKTTINLGDNLCIDCDFCSNVLYYGKQFTQVSCGISPFICQCEGYGPSCQEDLCSSGGLCRCCTAPYFCQPEFGGGENTNIDFSIVISPAIRIIDQGETTIYDVTVGSLNGFNSTVFLSVSECPPNSTCFLSATSLTPDPDSSTSTILTILTTTSTPPSTPQNPYSISIIGDSDGLIRSANTNLQVNLITTTSATYLLNIQIQGNGSGTVTSTPAGINCGSDCQENYNSGTTVTLTATPLQGSTFSGWQGACSGQNSTCQFTMNQDKNVVAVFESSSPPPPPPPPPPPSPLTLTVNVSPPRVGTVRVSPPNNSINSASTFSYATSTNVMLSVVSSSPGYVFQEWRGDCSGTTTTCSITVDRNKTVTAIFKTRGTIREIIPFNPPSLNQFLKQTAAIIFNLK